MITHIYFFVAYDPNGMIEFNELVPFRLTRNMQAFFSNFGVEGLIVSAMCSAAQSVVSSKQSQHIWHHLAMFFRDELLSWSWRRPLGIPSVPVAAGMINPLDFQQKVINNVDHVINRIKSISPHYLADEEEDTTEPPQSVQRGVTDLVEAALSSRNLCMMDPTWHPWF
jgi:transformation/transcription domain-associated protein